MELDVARHVRYFQRCYKSLLPHHYTPNDSTRLLLGYLIIAGLDLLSSPSSYSHSHQAPDPKATKSQSLIPTEDRPRLRAWILSLQHRNGGFCGSPHHVVPRTFRRGFNAEMILPTSKDPENANIAATLFALLLLGLLADEGDDGAKKTYIEVDRDGLLSWLKRLQRPDGSFGEVVTRDGTIGGGRDMRYCYMAAVIRWILRGDQTPDLDFNVDSFVAYIRRSQSFDGGIADISMGESHAGYAFCAVAALSFLDLTAEDADKPNRYLEAGIPDIPALVHWLVCRQFAYSEEGKDEEEADEAEEVLPDIAILNIQDYNMVGFNGRLNKVADTCYTWWVTGALQILDSALPGIADVDKGPARTFLLEKTQHVVGGFGKHAHRPPDVYHSYLGLAALVVMAGEQGEPGLGRFDVRLCVGKEVAERIAKARESLQIYEEDSDDE